MPPSRITFSLSAIAARLGGDVLGDGDVEVTQVAPLSSARAGNISFLAHAKYRAQLADTGASAVIVPPAFSEATSLPRIVTANPYAYYARATALLNPPPALLPGIAASAVLSSRVPDSCYIGPGVVIGQGVTLGEHVVLHPGCVLGDGVSVGAGSVLYPHVSIYADCQIGERAVIHSGAVIGADGFGFAPDQGQWIKIPQIGRVVIGDDVEIGANTSIDRGALEDTMIGNGCKLDNQIQVGHGCVIGDHTVIAGCVGIAGSTHIGKHCAFGGAAMVLGHLDIVDGVTVSPGSMVMKSIRHSGKYTALYPLAEHGEWLRNASHLRHLNTLAERIEELEKKLKEIETRD